MINKIDKYRYKNMPQEQINQLFLESCSQGNLEKIQFFLLDKSIVNAQVECEKYQCLFNAATAKQNHVVHFLLTSKKIKNPSIDTQNGRLLNIAFQTHNIDLIDYLLNFETGKRIDLSKKGDEIFISLMGSFSNNYEIIKLLVIKYNISKTQKITDFLDEKNRNLEEKKIVNDWFEKRDLKNVMEYVYPKKEDNVKIKKLKI